MDTLRLNIVLLPNKEITAIAQQISQSLHDHTPTAFILDNKTYFVHNTMYQLAIPSYNLESLYGTLEAIAHTTKPFSIETGNQRIWYDTFVSWDIKRSSILQSLHNFIVSKTNDFREGLSMVDPKTIGSFSPVDQHDITTYGSLLIGQQYKPHITITRLLSVKDGPSVTPLFKPYELTSPITSLHVGICGIHGTVNAIIKTFPLRG